jgi:hypothetical protein
LNSFGFILALSKLIFQNISFSSSAAFFYLIFVLLHRPLSFSCPPLSCTVLGDCLSKQVVLRGAVFSFSKFARKYQLVIQAISPGRTSSVVLTLSIRTLSITTMRFTCFGQVQPPGCIAPSDTLSSQAHDRGVNRLSFCLLSLGGGGVSLRAAGNHPVEKVIIAGKKISSIVESSSARPPTVICLYVWAPMLLILRAAFVACIFQAKPKIGTLTVILQVEFQDPCKSFLQGNH